MHREFAMVITHAKTLMYTDYSVDLGLTIENNSGKNLSFISGSMGYSCNSINGYMINDGYLNCDVADGKKANDTEDYDPIDEPTVKILFE